MKKGVHVPVLQEEVLAYLPQTRTGAYIDATLDGGGHAEAILAASAPRGKLLGIEKDAGLLPLAQKRLAPYHARVVLVQDDYRNIAAQAARYDFGAVDGILYDLGLSSWHFDESGRGFTFKKNEPLDMRFDVAQTKTAADIVNGSSLESLTDILQTYGEEKRAKRIAEAIVDARRYRAIKTTDELLSVIEPAFARGGKKKGKVQPATKTFQAIRIAVNDELISLERSLPQALRLLRSGGRLLVITFHSLEAKVVKMFAAMHVKEVKIIERSIAPTKKEIESNPKARSAILRVFEKI